MRLCRREILAGGAAAAALALAPRQALAAPGLYFPPPDGAWQSVAPNPIAAAALEEALRFAGENNSRAVVVLWRGRILGERYWTPGGVAIPDADVASGAYDVTAYVKDVGSAQKSIVSMMIAALLQDGALGVDDTVTSHLGVGWSGTTPGLDPATEGAITIRILLSQSTGLTSELNVLAAPGEAFVYSGAWFALHRVIERLTGGSVQDFARRRIFDAIGVTAQTRFYVRGGADAIDPYGTPELGLLATGRDFARLGLLALARGRWRGANVVAHRPYWREALVASQPTNEAYGWLWWLNGTNTHRLVHPFAPTREGPLIPGAPDDLFCALGKGDQKLYVASDKNVVVARLGRDAASDNAALSAFDIAWWGYLAPLVAAL